MDSMEAKDKAFRDNLLHTMDSEYGMAVLMRLINEGGCYDDCFSSDPLVMARETGRQEWARWLRRQMISVSPRRFLEAEFKQHAEERRT